MSHTRLFSDVGELISGKKKRRNYVDAKNVNQEKTDADQKSATSGNSDMEISRAVLGVPRREAAQRTPTIGPLCEETSRHDAETRQVGSRPTRATVDLTMKIDPLRLRQSRLDTTRRVWCH